MTVDDERLWVDVCMYPTRLTEIEQDAFEDFPDAVHPALAILRCRLQLDHLGPHISDGMLAATSESARWFRWDHDRREMFDADMCHAVSDRYELEPGEPSSCSLPAGHGGAHGFEFTPDRQWPFPEETRLARLDFADGRE